MSWMRSAGRYSGDARRGMAVLAVAGFVLLVIAYFLVAWQQAAAERLRQAAAEHEMVAARAAKAARDGATRLTGADDVTPMFLAGDTPGLAFARFQSIVGEAASAAGLAVKRMQPVDTGDTEAGMPYRLNVDAEGSIAQMRDFLVAVEAALPVMFVTGLEAQPAAATGEAGQYPSEALRMTIRIEAYGWRAAL